MATQASTTPTVGQLLQDAEKLPMRDFELFVVKVLRLNASRHPAGLAPDDSVILKKINKSFPVHKMERFLELDEKRHAETLSSDEYKELLGLVRQLEKYDAQRIYWIGQLAILRGVPLDHVMEQLGLNPISNG